MNAVDIISLIHKIFGIIGTVAIFIYFFMPVYTIIGFFATKKFPKAKQNHKYAIMIAARNEEAVIGNLIDSINAQDYPGELIEVFVVADNCTDNTAEVARSHGAVCYERFDTEHRTKGYALEFLTENIERDYGITSFEAYFIFDADNLLKKDYITRMNEAFDSGEKIVTSYRNTKNFDDNWIAASYGLHWIRTVRHEHRGRSALGLASRIQGTGFMFASEIIKNGWHYVSFTEDRAFAADAVVGGYRISYCDRAEFYDEQPTSLRIAFRQRIRWGKGHLQAFAESGPKLLKHIFVAESERPEYKKAETNYNTVTDSTVSDLCDDATAFLKTLLSGKAGNLKGVLRILALVLLVPLTALACVLLFALLMISKLADNICVKLKKSPSFMNMLSGRRFAGLKLRFMSYDMFSVTFPNNLISFVSRIAEFLLGIFLVAEAGRFVFDISNPIIAPLAAFALGYAGNILIGVYVFIAERRRIIPMPVLKKIFYCIMWPMFDLIGEITVFVAMFSHVEWKTIPHSVSVSIDDISNKTNDKNKGV